MWNERWLEIENSRLVMRYQFDFRENQARMDILLDALFRADVSIFNTTLDTLSQFDIDSDIRLQQAQADWRVSMGLDS